MRRLLEGGVRGGTYFQVGEINNIKCQSLVIFSFRIRIKQIFTINKSNITKKLNINNIFIVLWFAYEFQRHFDLATSRI